MNLKEMFDKSRELWGINSQILMFVEELNELSVASLHLLRKLKNNQTALEHFAEEMSDVQFLMEEIVYYFKKRRMNKNTDETFFDALIRHRKFKEKRLAEILKGE